jgi:4-hydroxy 2-oxovalerate aldolase
MKKPIILDCTLRDGGYYVDWDFEDSLVKKYLSAVSVAKIDIVEIGFRFLPSNRFLGAFAYSTDKYLRTIGLPKNVLIAVMINASEIIGNKGCDIRSTVNQLFIPKQKSPVSIVRVATHINDIINVYEIVDELRSLGYRVFLNLMQIDGVEDEKIVSISALIENWGLIEVLYFADSLGGMNPNRVKKIVGLISINWSGPLGIHAHDNKGLALPNTLEALECGVEYLDATLRGMGRGAGNAKTEYLLVEIMQIMQNKYFPDALFPLVLQEFADLQGTYKWGENAYYFLSAIYGIHPTYAQEMLSGEIYDTGQVLSAINFLRKSQVPFYSFEKMLTALIGMKGSSSGGWSANNWAENRSVLILAPGPELNKHIRAIKNYIKTKEPIVLCLNINDTIPENFVTAYIACYETRILIESDGYNKLSTPIILPLDRIPNSIKESLDQDKILDFGLSIEKGKFEIKDNGCVLSSSLALFYAISVATASGSKNIFIAGADGYNINDPRYKEVASLFEKYNHLDVSLPIYAITKTTYPINHRSIYDPSL